MKDYYKMKNKKKEYDIIEDDDFKDIALLNELSLRKLWDNKEDEIWDTV